MKEITLGYHLSSQQGTSNNSQAQTIYRKQSLKQLKLKEISTINIRIANLALLSYLRLNKERDAISLESSEKQLVLWPRIHKIQNLA